MYNMFIIQVTHCSAHFHIGLFLLTLFFKNKIKLKLSLQVSSCIVHLLFFELTEPYIVVFRDVIGDRTRVSYRQVCFHRDTFYTFSSSSNVYKSREHCLSLTSNCGALR